MLAAHFLERVAHDVEEIVVGIEDPAVHAELGHRLRFSDGSDLPPVVRVAFVALTQCALHGVERAQQLAGFIFAGYFDLVVELSSWTALATATAFPSGPVMLRARVMASRIPAISAATLAATMVLRALR